LKDGAPAINAPWVGRPWLGVYGIELVRLRKICF
jgi:hypothetical protein